MTTDDPSLAALTARLAALEAELTARKGASRRVVAIGAVLSLTAVGTAWAATGSCPNGLPFCFTADQPAVASEVNHNFAQLKEWLEGKVGAVGSAPVFPSATVQGAATFSSGATFSGGATFPSTNSFAGATTFGGGSSLTVNGTFLQPGYEVSCFSSTNIAPVCCRLAVRDGSTSCLRATDGAATAWNGPAVQTPFTAAAAGRYSLHCWPGFGGINYPGCCRAELNSGAVRCKSANDWNLTSWTGESAPF